MIPDTVKDILSGTFGGIAQVLVGQPFDIVKVRVQTAPPGTYNGVLDCVSKIALHEGPLAFYKGTFMPLVGVGACVSVQFAVVQEFKRRFCMFNERFRGTSHLDDLQLYTSGAVAGIANSVIASPVEHIRIRMQTQRQGEYHGPIDCLTRFVAADKYHAGAWNEGPVPWFATDRAA